MSRIAIVYTSFDGHSARIARRIGDVLHARGHAIEVREVTTLPTTFSLRAFQAVILGAPVRWGRIPRPLRRFVRQNRALLESVPTWLFTASAMAASAHGRPAMDGVLVHFERSTRFWPVRAHHFAGKLAYSRHRGLVRLAMRVMAWAAGLPTDPARDYDLTDWRDVRLFALDFDANLSPGERRAVLHLVTAEEAAELDQAPGDGRPDSPVSTVICNTHSGR